MLAELTLETVIAGASLLAKKFKIHRDHSFFIVLNNLPKFIDRTLAMNTIQITRRHRHLNIRARSILQSYAISAFADKTTDSILAHT